MCTCSSPSRGIFILRACDFPYIARAMPRRIARLPVGDIEVQRHAAIRYLYLPVPSYYCANFRAVYRRWDIDVVYRRHRIRRPVDRALARAIRRTLCILARRIERHAVVGAEVCPELRVGALSEPSPACSFGHAANSQFGPVRPTDEPSGQSMASCGQIAAPPPPGIPPAHKYQPPARRIMTTAIETSVVVFIY